VGIDLGTTFSVIAIRTDEGTKVFRDKQGRALVPSGVYFGQDGSERDQRALLFCIYVSIPFAMLSYIMWIIEYILIFKRNTKQKLTLILIFYVHIMSPRCARWACGQGI
jgi:hypothetical protein